MRRLLILRHSKATPSSGRDDYDRTLTERGREDARHVGSYIASHDMVPDVVLFSSAARTRETAEAAMAGWPASARWFSENGLYEATRHFILTVIQGLTDDAASAMIVGHNPGMSEIANYLAGSGAESDRLRMAAKFPTSALAVLDFSVARWSEITPRSGRLAHFLTPSDLDA